MPILLHASGHGKSRLAARDGPLRRRRATRFSYRIADTDRPMPVRSQSCRQPDLLCHMSPKSEGLSECVFRFQVSMQNTKHHTIAERCTVQSTVQKESDLGLIGCLPVPSFEIWATFVTLRSASARLNVAKFQQIVANWPKSIGGRHCLKQPCKRFYWSINKRSFARIWKISLGPMSARH